MESDPHALYEETRRRELPHFCRHMLHDYTARDIILHRKHLWAEMEQLGIEKEIYPHGLFGRPAKHSRRPNNNPIALENIDLQQDSYAVATREACKRMYFPDDEDWERYLELYYPFVDRDQLHQVDYFLDDRLTEKNLMHLVPARNERPYLPDPLQRLQEWQTTPQGTEGAPRELLHLVSRMRGELFHLLDEGTPSTSYEEQFPHLDWVLIWSTAKLAMPHTWHRFKYGVEVTVRRALYDRKDIYKAVETYLTNQKDKTKGKGYHEGVRGPAQPVAEKYYPLRLNGGKGGWRRRDDKTSRHTLDETTIEMTEGILERWQESA